MTTFRICNIVLPLFQEIIGAAGDRPARGARLPAFVGLRRDPGAMLDGLKAVVVGAGNVGRPIAVHLARQQIDTLWIIDRGEWAFLNKETVFSCQGFFSGERKIRTATTPTRSVSFLCSLAADLALTLLLRLLLGLGQPVCDTTIEHCGYTHRTVAAPLKRNPDLPEHASVKVIGLGGVGGIVARYGAMFLASLGKPVRLVLIDGDPFEPSNATRMYFSGHGNKAVVTRADLLPRFADS